MSSRSRSSTTTSHDSTSSAEKLCPSSVNRIAKTKKPFNYNSIECESIFQFTKNLWQEDPLTSLKYILNIPLAAKVFESFLKTEHCEIELEFYQEAQELEKVSETEADIIASRLFRIYSRKKDNTNLQNLTKASEKKTFIRNWIKRESVHALKELADNAFPRFVHSKYYDETLHAILKYGLLENDDEDECINILMSMAETMPCCISISDVTLSDAPLIYVNPKFCDVTGYRKEEILGHSCRFLHGPATEPEAVQVVINALTEGQDCHVKLTNYRKNGERFKTSLSFRSIFDDSNVYRYLIGIRFEIKESDNLNERLVQLDRFCRFIPSKLRSHKTTSPKNAAIRSSSQKYNNAL